MRKEWYVIQVYSGMENKVKEVIEEKAKMIGYSKYLGRIVVPEIEEVDYTNKKSEKIIVDFDTKLFVKKGKDVKKGDLIARSHEVRVQEAGVIKEVKNYRKIIIETKGKKYSKTFLIPENADIVSGLKLGKSIKAGTPFTADGIYESDVEGEIVHLDKVKRIVVKTPKDVEEVYVVSRKTFDSKHYKPGTELRQNEKISAGVEYKAKTTGRAEIKQNPMNKEIKLIKTSRKKLFPGYVFIEMIYMKDLEKFIQNETYVSSFLNIGGKPIKLRREEARALLRLAGEEVFEEKRSKNIKIDYEIGEYIKIISGPFEMFTGKIQEIDVEKAEVKVLVSMFGRETLVELDLSEIEEISE